jgi:hypothetical protein
MFLKTAIGGHPFPQPYEKERLPQVQLANKPLVFQIVERFSLAFADLRS